MIFVAQHVADRYSPALYPKVVWRVGLIWLTALSTIAIAALGLALVENTWQTEIAAACLLAAAIIITVLGLYRTFRVVADRTRILDMATRLGADQRAAALRDLVWSCAHRGDVQATDHLLGFPQHGTHEQA